MRAVACMVEAVRVRFLMVWEGYEEESSGCSQVPDSKSRLELAQYTLNHEQFHGRTAQKKASKSFVLMLLMYYHE